MQRLYQIISVFLLLIVGCPIGASTARASGVALQDDETAPVEILIDGSTQFAFDLYRQLAKSEANIIYSPYSVTSALAMLYAGARGDTADQMADTLHLDLPPEDVHGAYRDLSDAVTLIDSDYEFPFQLTVANAIWPQIGYPVAPEYVALLDQYYDAGLVPLDFANAPEDSRITINEWVSEKTTGRIDELLAPGSLSPMSRMVLTNAIYFNGSWRMLFDP